MMKSARQLGRLVISESIDFIVSKHIYVLLRTIGTKELKSLAGLLHSACLTLGLLVYINTGYISPLMSGYCCIHVYTFIVYVLFLGFKRLLKCLIIERLDRDSNFQIP